MAARPAARDFVTDAVAHCKFVGYTSGAAVLFEAAGLPVRYWDREFAVLA